MTDQTTTPADHPHTDPGDGRTECDRCGKWVFLVTHSCKGVPVTDRARARATADGPAYDAGDAVQRAEQVEADRDRLEQLHREEVAAHGRTLTQLDAANRVVTTARALLNIRDIPLLGSEGVDGDPLMQLGTAEDALEAALAGDTTPADGEIVRIDCDNDIWHQQPDGRWWHHGERPRTLDDLDDDFGPTRLVRLVPVPDAVAHSVARDATQDATQPTALCVLGPTRPAADIRGDIAPARVLAALEILGWPDDREHSAHVEPDGFHLTAPGHYYGTAEDAIRAADEAGDWLIRDADGRVMRGTAVTGAPGDELIALRRVHCAAAVFEAEVLAAAAGRMTDAHRALAQALASAAAYLPITTRPAPAGTCCPDIR